MRPRSAFTIIEVMVALAVSGLVLLGARAMLEAVGDRAANIASAARAANYHANAERTLRALVENLEIGTVPGTAFSGDEAAARFASWCDVPGGWRERCSVTIALERGSDGNSLIARSSTGLAIRVRSGFETGSLRYLVSAESGGVWIRSWGTGITAPLAIGVVTDRDTLILRIGERG